MKCNIEDIAEKMTAMGITYNSAYLYIIKHLNRQHKARMDIPIWTGHEWNVNKIMWINEAPKGKVLDSNHLIKIGFKPEEIAGKHFTLMYNVIDNNINQCISSGVCENRDDIWKKYCELIDSAYNHYMVMSGKPIIQEVQL